MNNKWRFPFLLVEVLLIIGLNIYIYVTYETTSSIETTLSTLVILNSLICPYTNSQLLKIYPKLINPDIPSPRKPFILICMIILMLPLVMIPIVQFAAHTDFADIGLFVIAFIHLVFYSITIMYSILQHLIFFGCITQKIISFDGLMKEWDLSSFISILIVMFPIDYNLDTLISFFISKN